MPPSDSLTSSGHKLGQIIGDWWELDVVFPLLESTGSRLGLFLDNRKLSRSCRAGKIQWPDVSGNVVDYDFVLELDGTAEKRGVPVAFIESFWRRGARHSKDKARDDTNKLLPMRDTYPTARYLAIAACGEFTEPAREYVRNRNVDLFFIPKSKIIEAFHRHNMVVDYPDSLAEDKKLALVNALAARLTPELKTEVASSLVEVAGKVVFEGFQSTIFGALSALPQEIRFVRCEESDPVCFDSVAAATDFIQNPAFLESNGSSTFRYEVTYSDGFEFSRNVDDWVGVQELQFSLNAYVEHITKIFERVH